MTTLLIALMTLASQDPPGFWERATLAGDAGGVRPALAEAGVTVTLELTAEVISNVHGGVRRDTGTDLLLDWMIDADLNKGLGWRGGSAHLNPLWLAGDGVAGDVGDLTLVSNITGRGGVRVFEAWLQQSLFDDRFSLRAGILAADQEFVVTQGGLLYANSVFGGPVFLTPNLAWPIYPVGAPGVRAKVDVSKDVYLQAAVYDGDPGSEDFNRSGLRHRVQSGDGVFAIAEIGQKGHEGYALKAGLSHHTGPAITAAYGLAELPVAPGVLMFCRVGYAQESRSFVAFGIDGGVNYTGCIPGRPRDVVGVGVIYARISEDFAGAQPDRARWGYETVFELTYKLVFSPWWNIQPDLQYVFHPGGSTAIPDAVVVGLRLDLFF